VSQTAHVDTRYFTVTCHASFEVYIYMYLSTWFTNLVLPVVCLVTVISPSLVLFIVSNVVCMIGMDMSIIGHSMKDHMYGSIHYHTGKFLFNILAHDLQDMNMYRLDSYKLTCQRIKEVFMRETWRFVQFVWSMMRNPYLAQIINS